jgi:carbon storage regulator CsrA
MLVLTRKEGEKISIFTADGQEIKIEVLRAMGSRVRLSFDAPDNTFIVREELTHDKGFIPERRPTEVMGGSNGSQVAEPTQGN